MVVAPIAACLATLNLPPQSMLSPHHPCAGEPAAACRLRDRACGAGCASLDVAHMAAEGDQLLFLRDVNDIEPPRDRYRHYGDEDIYRLVPKPLWTGMEEELWSPRANEHDPQLEKMKQMIKRNSQGNGSIPQGFRGADTAPTTQPSRNPACSSR